ncbi:MAG: BatD family protein, partial [Pseudomonas sp.]
MSRVCVFVLSLFLCLQTQAAALIASVDRTRLNAGETLELTLQTQDVTQFGKPDLTPLNANFEVRDTRQ